MSKLLLEGAVAGHMNHIYDNGEMSFGELKQLLQAAADGKLRGTEKTDGQNIFLSFNVLTQRAVAIRNQTMIKVGGLNSDGMDQWYADHPKQAIRYSFVEAIKAFEEVVLSMDKETQSKIFGSGVELRKYKDKRKPDFLTLTASGVLVYYNCEVMNPGNPDLPPDDPRAQGTTNVIPYDKKTLLIHDVGHIALDAETGRETEIDTFGGFELLQGALIGKAHDEPARFSVETHEKRSLAPEGIAAAKEMISSVIDNLDNLMRDAGVNDTNTINDYVIAQITPIIDSFGLTEDRNKLILRKAMNYCLRADGQPGYVNCSEKESDGTRKAIQNPNINKIVKGLPPETVEAIKKFISEFKYGSFVRSIQMALYDFSVSVLNGFESRFISDNEKQIRFLQNEIQQSIEKIKNSSNEEAQRVLELELERLKGIENINTPSEGFVFNFNGKNYKFTGAFAPANQILGMERFQRFGPLIPREESDESLEPEFDPSEGIGEEITIALLPGSFKPPHRGHLALLETISADADKAYVIISRPLKKARTLPLSGKTITAEQALQCWHVFLEHSKAKKIVGPGGIMIGNTVSPIPQTEEFITLPADPNNKLIAPPNSTVILGVGDKGDDAKRYANMIEKAKKLRPDLKVIQKAVPAVEHSPEYLRIIEENPTIAQGLKRENREQFHASDLRYLMDVAERDPIGLTLLRDFVRSEEDVLAILGICNINPIDSGSVESDQVQEPEIDSVSLAEFVFSYVSKILNEGFKKQHSGPGGKSSDLFQINMKKRLSKAHSFYLDQGLGPRGHHGGGFRLPRDKKNDSNAFLAEEEIAEMSAMAGGNVAIAPGNNKKNEEDTLMREEEKILRKKIRIALKEFFKKKNNNANIVSLVEEHKLRMKLRHLIFETATEDPTVDVHDNTGINTLKDLLKSSNVLSTLRNVYKTLTTDDNQKSSFRAHIVQWIQDTLAPIRLNDADTGDPTTDAQEMEGPLSEIQLSEWDLGVDIKGVDASTGSGDLGKMIQADDGSPKEKVSNKEENPMRAIGGEDTTGRNKAERVYPTIEKSIIDYYAELDNDEDQEMFYDYLIANIKLYFDKWDGEMSSTPPEEPTNDEYDQAKQAI